MEKILPVLIIGLLVLSAVGVVGLPIEKSTYSKLEPQPELQVKIRGGFGVNLEVTNVGDADATDVLYFIYIGGGLLECAPNSKLGDLGNITPGQTKKVRFSTIGFGIGILSDIPFIEVLVDCEEDSRVEFNQPSWILFKVFLIK